MSQVRFGIIQPIPSVYAHLLIPNTHYVRIQQVNWDKYRQRYWFQGRSYFENVSSVNFEGVNHFWESDNGIDWTSLKCFGLDYTTQGIYNGLQTSTPLGLVSAQSSTSYDFVTAPGNQDTMIKQTARTKQPGIGSVYKLKAVFWLDNYSRAVIINADPETAASNSAYSDLASLFITLDYRTVSQTITVADNTTVRVGIGTRYATQISSAAVTATSGNTVTVADSTNLDTFAPGIRYYGSDQDTTGQQEKLQVSTTAGSEDFVFGAGSTTYGSQGYMFATNPHTGTTCHSYPGKPTSNLMVRYREGNTGNFVTVPNAGSTVWGSANKYSLAFLGGFDTIQSFVGYEYNYARNSDQMRVGPMDKSGWDILESRYVMNTYKTIANRWHYSVAKKLWVNSTTNSSDSTYTIHSINEWGVLKTEFSAKWYQVGASNNYVASLPLYG